MFLRKAFSHVTESEARIIATRKPRFWLKRIACTMAKIKAMCIINRSSKLIGIQHEKKHGKGKGSKNSPSHFDDRIDIEDVTDKLIEDDRYDEYLYDDVMCA